MTLSRIAIVAALALAASAGPTLAHPDHDMPRMALDQADLSAKAKTIISALIERNIVEATWAAAPAGEVRERVVEGAAQRVVVFRNSAASDPAKRDLYVVLTPYGDYIAANHNGQ